MSQALVMVVTGEGRGIVAINYLHNHAAAEEVAGYIRQQNGQAVTIQADISQETDVLSLFQLVDAQLGRVSALVNNAGTLERQARLDEMDATRIERIFAVNVVGQMICAREAVKRMSTRHGGGGGAIVNVSSGAAKYGSPGEYVDYAASKGAVETFTVGLASEVAEEGIRVNAVRPGFIYTEFHAKGGEPARVDRGKGSGAHAAGRSTGRGRKRDSVASVRGGVVRYGHCYRCVRREVAVVGGTLPAAKRSRT